jgi:hypothetical protein
MRHQIRLLDQNLPGLARELALSCARSVDPRAGVGVYRELFRAVRDVLKERVFAMRYCGSTSGCEHSLRPREQVVAFRHEAFPGERVRVYLTAPETPPEVLIRELADRALRAAVRAMPGKHLKGISKILHDRIEETLKGRLFTAGTCGDLPICGMNEPLDAWDRREPANAVRVRAFG